MAMLRLPQASPRAAACLGRLALGVGGWALGLTLATQAASCVGLLDLDGYAGAADELCAKIDACFGAQYRPECAQRLGERLDGAGPKRRAAWLVYFADHSCTESCFNARRCLDEPPLCAGLGQSCSGRTECCGFSAGAGECGGLGAQPQCCRPEGFTCNGDGECCANDCIGGFCGGVPCKPDYAPCSAGAECCKKICLPDSWSCSAETCLELGAPCVNNDDCCLKYCAPTAGGSVCAEPACRLDPLPCDGQTPCCPPLTCWPLPDQSGSVCSTGECLPVGMPCTPETQCCDGPCSAGQCRANCAPLTFPCTSSIQCCSNYCAESSGLGTCSCKDFGATCGGQTQCCHGSCTAQQCTCRPEGEPCRSALDCCSPLWCDASFQCSSLAL